MTLNQFQKQVGTADATAIRARELDENFRRVTPIANGQYGINETSAGWHLNIFPAFPISTTDNVYLVYQAGSMQWKPLPFVESPATGLNASWRLVERCDGKRAYFWGTDWFTP
jgi:hypothetical protein